MQQREVYGWVQHAMIWLRFLGYTDQQCGVIVTISNIRFHFLHILIYQSLFLNILLKLNFKNLIYQALIIRAARCDNASREPLCFV